MANPTLYDILEVIPSASQETIHAAYRSLMSRYHPDKVATLGGELQALAATRTKEINHAYSVLRDATKRASYDEQLRRGATPPPHQSSGASAERPSGARASQPRSGLKDMEARQLRAAGIAALAGNSALFILPRLPDAVLDILTSLQDPFHFPSIRDVPSLICNSSEGALWLVLPTCLFLNYLIGVWAYRCGALAGVWADRNFSSAGFGRDCPGLLFNSFVVIVAIEAAFSARSVMSLLADCSILVGAYEEKNRRFR